jgi:hypothetical protein
VTWKPTPLERLRLELEGAQEELDELTAVVDAVRDAMHAGTQEEFNAALDAAFDAVADCDDAMTPSPSPCADCTIDTTPIEADRPWEYYMVRDEQWKVATGKKPADFLCVGCLETRLARRLTSADFSGAPINDPDKLSISPRLRDRMLSPN